MTTKPTDLGVDTNFPLSETLRLLVEWAKHLHDSHECDCDGWEQRSFLIEAAQRYQNEIAQSSAPASAAPVVDETLVDEVQNRMDQVVEVAVEWHQAGREGREWFEAAEKLGAAIDSLLELRSKPAATGECFCGTDLEAGLCPNGHDPVRGSSIVAAATAAPVEQSDETEALRYTNILCRSSEGRPKVEIWFKDLKTAQRIHKWLVSLAANVNEGAR